MQAYLPLDAEQQQEFQRLVATESYGGVQAMNTTWYEKGLEKGREETRRMLQEQVEERFGPLSAAVEQRLAELPAERLPGLARAVVRAQSLRDLGLED